MSGSVEPLPTEAGTGGAGEGSVLPVAVIDIGTSAIRMAIAEINDAGGVRTLETLSQAVNLGRDAFTRSAIDNATIEDCVRVLRSYRQLLSEYQIERPEQIRVIATSAVREAQNRLALVDRIYSATGFDVEPIDEAEVNRITYFGIQPFLKEEPALAEATTIVTEVGGGSTELLLVQKGEVAYSHSYRLGSLRLRETLEAYRAPKIRTRTIMEHQIARTVAQIAQHVPNDSSVELVVMGGDVRFAASQLIPDWNPGGLGRMPLSALEEFTDKMLAMSEDELVQKYHLSFPDAATLGPALLAYVLMARGLGVENVHVTNINLRDGLLEEMASRGAWREEFHDQIIRSVIDLGRKFDFDQPHARQVAELSTALFRELQDEHRLDARYELILYIAALLHEIGQYVGSRGFHKHSLYLILNSELFGLTRKDLLLVGLVARYHRRASPKPTHEGYATLDREERIAVSKMSAMLRVADALDRSRSQRIQELRCSRENAQLVISIPHVDDLSLEQLALRQKGTLFEEVFGIPVLLRRSRRPRLA